MAQTRVQALLEEVHAEYVGKVLHGSGIVLAILSLVSFGGGTIHQGSDGSALYSTDFTALVFAPEKGDVAIATIVHSDRDGIRLSIGFFHDIFVPADGLQDPSHFHAQDSVWCWYPESTGTDTPKAEDAAAEQSVLPMLVGEHVRFMVDSVVFPEHPETAEYAAQLDPLHGGTPSGAFAPMVVVGTVNDDGLGCVSWWT